MTGDMSKLRRESGHLASPALLHKIDELREKNIGQHVPLPQVSSGVSAHVETA